MVLHIEQLTHPLGMDTLQLGFCLVSVVLCFLLVKELPHCLAKVEELEARLEGRMGRVMQELSELMTAGM
jgi:hypothetical protein